MTTGPIPPAALTWRGVTARRMARHALAEPAAGLGPADIAGAMCGAHAQVLSAATRALTPAGQAGNYPVLLVDGVVGGVWHQRRYGRKLAITVEPPGELTAAQRRQLDDEVDLVGAVMEAPATLTVGAVTVGAHA